MRYDADANYQPRFPDGADSHHKIQWDVPLPAWLSDPQYVVVRAADPDPAKVTRMLQSIERSEAEARRAAGRKSAWGCV